jgi:hypothetical protein
MRQGSDVHVLYTSSYCTASQFTWKAIGVLGLCLELEYMTPALPAVCHCLLFKLPVPDVQLCITMP